MSAPTRLKAQLAHAGWAVLSWVDDTVKGRRALAQERSARRRVEHQLSEQIGINARLIGGPGQGAGGGAE